MPALNSARRRLVSAALLLALALVPAARPVLAAPAVAALPAAAQLARDYDALLAKTFKADEPGAAILVTRGGQVLYRKGFGLADAEARTPLTPDMVLRIGSVTKQFTAAAILKLAEAGKLQLSDDFHKYLPDYPATAPITIENLLTHTSGIVNYTTLPAWHARKNETLSPAQLVDLFKSEPLQFPPGTRWSYSNSGYFLLGVIIEKVTGQSYADYMRTALFEPLGLKDTQVGESRPTKAPRAKGYARNDTGVVPAEPIDMSSPYAAGAITSTVDDLARWARALDEGKVISAASCQRMFTPFKLTSGQSTGYGYGWGINNFEGHAIHEHSGGIDGFVSHDLDMPDDGVFVAVLCNTEEPAVDPAFTALKLAAGAIGRPLPEPGNFHIDPARLDDFTGVYQVDSLTTRVITRDGDTLFSQRRGGQKLELFAVNDSVFAFQGRASTLTFSRDTAGKVNMVTIRQGGVVEPAPKTDQSIPTGPVAVDLDEATLDGCVGRFELAPGFALTITREGKQLKAQATGQGAFEIYPESPTMFFVKVVDAKIEFQRGPDGKATSLTLHQAGRQMPAKRVE